MRVIPTICVLTALVTPSLVGAQQAPTPGDARTGVITGAVVDSIRGGLLAGAVVALENGSRQAVTDSLGRFLLDAVQPGAHRLVLLDDLLDTLSLSVMTPPVAVSAGDTAFMILAIPAAETVVRAKCGAGPFPLGRSALFGVVIDAETEQRVAGADVVLAWTDVQASRETGLRSIPRQRSVKAAADGSFRICGLPDQLSGELIAWEQGDTTAAVPFALDNAIFAIRTLALPGRVTEVTTESAAGASGAAPGQSQPVARARRGRATVSGTVQSLTGAPIVGARVSVAGADGSTITNERGEFALTGQPAGTQTVQVRKLGYEPAQFGLNLSPSRAAEVTIELPEFVPVLSTVVVRAALDVGLDRVGFTKRRQVGLGRFMSLEDIERRNAHRVVDLLADFPMLRAISTGGTSRTITGRSRGMETNCVTFYVDGMIWMGDDSPIEYMLPQEIAAVEAYSGGTTPAEFQRTMTSCETVVIWTKHRVGIVR
jgi:hypothetical protein